jgi:prepilin-type N-terminal cleavage/methylation domain-containing protein/prepilin-type processing-associated H-X9-DG protein
VRRRLRRGFTLVELLVVIAVIALLAALIVPALGGMRQRAAISLSRSNLHQLGTALAAYAAERGGHLPASVYPPRPGEPRFHWTDALWPFLGVRDVYLSPCLTGEELSRMSTPFHHDASLTFGGYGYNYQYLGNGRFNAAWSAPWDAPFHGRLGSTLADPAGTIAVADTHGSRADKVNNANGRTLDSPWTSQGTFTIDPPLASRTLGSRGSRRADGGPTASANYGNEGGGDGVLMGEGGAAHSRPGDPVCRATPAERNLGLVNIVFLDGHVDGMTARRMDDANGDGEVDNGLWNGLGRPDTR